MKKTRKEIKCHIRISLPMRLKDTEPCILNRNSLPIDNKKEREERKMSRKIELTYNESTGEISFDLDGYDGNDCEEEWEWIKKMAAIFGLDLGDVEQNKKPRIPNAGARKNKIGGGR